MIWSTLLWLAIGSGGLEGELRSLIRDQPVFYGIAFRHLARGEEVLINADTLMHAASTMKVPVMMRLFLKEARGELALSDTLTIRNRFASIVDGTPYAITVDSDEALYEHMGKEIALEKLIHLMITRSSNLATNLLIDLADAEKTTRAMRGFGAEKIRVLRGVEDIKAFEAGLNNTATAHDMMRIMTACAASDQFSPAARDKMLSILAEQEFKEMIPAGIPADSGAHIANKTGSISRVEHDCAVITLPDHGRYVLVVFTRFTPNSEEERALAKKTAREISRLVYEHVTR